MTSEEDRKLLLLETLVNNQKHMIELLSILNNNVIIHIIYKYANIVNYLKHMNIIY